MAGEIMGEVRDETRDAKPTFIESEPGKVVSSRARARSTGPLRFHTDRCDVIALMCVRNGIEGGVSQARQHPDDPQRDVAPPARPGGPAVPGLLALPPEG